MCFVGYVHFACGHKRIDSRDCDYALAVQSPFFIRYQCPNYTQARASPDFACGTGKFYCKETKDGPFLEHLHQTVAVARDDMTRIEAQLAKMMEASHMFTEEWNRRGVPSVVRPQLQSFQYISTQHRRLMVERGNTRQTHDQSLAVIEQARAYFTRVNHSFRMGEAPAYPPGSRDRGMTTSSQPSAGKPPKQESSLGDRINDWARQSKLAEATTPIQRRVMPGMKDLLNSSPANGTPMSTMTSSSPVRAVGTAHRISMPGSSYPKDMKYSMSDPTGLDAVQQHHTQTGLSLTPSLVRPEIISARAPRHPSFLGLPTSAHTSTTTLPGATDWLVYGQHVHDLSHPHMIPASFSTAPAFNPILQRGASGSGPGSFAAPGTQPFGFRKDSITGHFEHPASYSLPPMLPPNYGNLRRSFSASTLLTPPVMPSNDTETSEPRKRKQTMRATDETSKRMRLSFPGEQTAAGITRNTEWLLSQGLERTPAPPNTYHGPVGSDVKAELTTSHHGGGPLASPAPRLAPTAVMSAPELANVSYEGTERQPIDQDEEQSNQYGVEFSDNIDWGTPFEENDVGLM
ncbi:hypothetical protein B0A54_01770 [Friedmanniomyces endolithicus]|uniref:Uncharacterized protein n=1 Tax=Friedmanniomyces endolithicus TaxID=329885 RepID=A0A4U0VGE5_9PEZI|nr:hypothetical protein B0A54_01770 [Friedmanniomyces endolithicus]